MLSAMVLMSLNKSNQLQLLRLARASIQNGLETGKPLRINRQDFSPELLEHRATFVTLEKNSQLRGCIGMLEAIRPLAEDIAENAFSAAFRDPRFPPLEDHELADLNIHLSILSPSESLSFLSEQDLIAQLRPGTDGLILEDKGHRGTFLPSVWTSLPNPRQFLQHLKQKAGLPADYWSESLKISRYTAEYIE